MKSITIFMIAISIYATCTIQASSKLSPTTVTFLYYIANEQTKAGLRFHTELQSRIPTVADLQTLNDNFQAHTQATKKINLSLKLPSSENSIIIENKERPILASEPLTQSSSLLRTPTMRKSKTSTNLQTLADSVQADNLAAKKPQLEALQLTQTENRLPKTTLIKPTVRTQLRSLCNYFYKKK